MKDQRLIIPAAAVADSATVRNDDSIHSDGQGLYSINDSDKCGRKQGYGEYSRGGFRSAIIKKRNHYICRFCVNGVRMIKRMLPIYLFYYRSNISRSTS